MRGPALLQSLSAILLLLSAAAWADEAAPRIYDEPIYETAANRVDIGGRRLNLVCLGSGSPTVIFDAGGGRWSFDWVKVQPEIARTTRACSYDRAGFGFSDPGPLPRTGLNAVADLHALLRAAGEKPPFVMVGHSLGGMIVRLYAHRYRDEVAGLVQVDGKNEDFDRLARSLIGKRYDRAYRNVAGFLKLGRECRAAVAKPIPEPAQRGPCVDDPADWLSPGLNRTITSLQWNPAYWDAALSEIQSNAVSEAQYRRSRGSLGDMPLIALIATRSGRGTAAEDAARFETIRSRLGMQVALLSSRGVLRPVPDSGHYIQFERSDSVIRAVEEVVAAVRQTGR